MNTISFPTMPFIYDMVFKINDTCFTIGSFTVKWYGVIIALGFILAALYVFKRSRQFGSNPDQLIDVMIWALPLAIVGARLYYVFAEWGYYKTHLSDIYRVWYGGLAIYGAVIAAFVTVLVFCKIKKINVWNILDLVSLGFLIGQCIGRWGNFVNAEAYGVSTDLPWGMVINGRTAVHPAFLYESLWTLVGFLILHNYSKRRKFSGEITLMYVAWYGLGRFFIEGLRIDSLYIGSTGLRLSQVLAAASCVIAVGFLVYLHISKKYKPVLLIAGGAPAGGADFDEDADDFDEDIDDADMDADDDVDDSQEDEDWIDELLPEDEGDDLPEDTEDDLSGKVEDDEAADGLDDLVDEDAEDALSEDADDDLSEDADDEEAGEEPGDDAEQLAIEDLIEEWDAPGDPADPEVDAEDDQ